jgi:hypothetical protein
MGNINPSHVHSIEGKVAVAAVTVTPTALISNPVGSGMTVKINSLYMTNIHGSTAGAYTIDIYRATVAYRMANLKAIAAKVTDTVIGNDSPLYLQEGDSLRVTNSADSIMEAVASYEEIR